MIWLMEILKILWERTALDKVLRDKAFKIATNLKYDQHLASIVYKCVDKKSAGSGIKNEITQN